MRRNFFFFPGGLRKGTTSEGSPSISVGRRGLADKNREGFLFPVEIGIKQEGELVSRSCWLCFQFKLVRK